MISATENELLAHGARLPAGGSHRWLCPHQPCFSL